MPDDVIDYEDYYALDALDLENEMLYVKCVHNSSGKIHPTQKPVELFNWLINTYTNAGDVVLDNCGGSGTTAISYIDTGREYIVIEKDEKYHQLSVDRVNEFKSK